MGMGSFQTDSAGFSNLNLANVRILCNFVNDLVGYPPYKLTMRGQAYYPSGGSQLRALPVLVQNVGKGAFSLSPGLTRWAKERPSAFVFSFSPFRGGTSRCLKGLKMRSVAFRPQA